MQIGFDTTQKERGRIFSNYQGLRSILEEGAIPFNEISEFPLPLSTLQKYDIIFFPCPDSSRLIPDEIMAILEYVSDGGNLILLNHAGGDQGRRTNLGSLTEALGITFNNDEVLDPFSNLGVDAYPIIDNFRDHPILQNIDNFCYRIGCSLTIHNEAIPLALTGNKATPPNQPVIGLVRYGTGHILASGSYEMFQDNVKGGIEYHNNAQLIRNIIKWLTKSQLSDLADSPLIINTHSNYSTPTTPITPLEPCNNSTNDNLFRKLSTQLEQFSTDLASLKEEQKEILNENIELREKLSIFELNLKDFPGDLLSELNIEVEGNITKIKSHSKLISNIASGLSDVQKHIKMIENKLHTLSNQIESVQPVSSPRSQKSSQKPTITTAAQLAQQTSIKLHPVENSKIQAFQQMLHLLKNNFQEGLLSQEEYHKKRRKFEKELIQLQEAT
ncbi:MAG: hypothetical protein ACTSQ8_19800 [Candidatus Helarchaeota archaeon]